MHPSPPNGPLLLYRFWVFILVMATWRRKTGGLFFLLERQTWLGCQTCTSSFYSSERFWRCVRPLQHSVGSVGPSLCYCPECVGLRDVLLAFWPFWGWPPNCACYLISFPLGSFGPFSFLSFGFACLDCPSRLLVSGWPDCWFCATLG